MPDKPLVSVVIPTFNRAGLVKRAIASVLNQTYRNLQIIIVDNASSDNTVEVVNAINDSRIKFIRHDINKGPAASRNTGINNATGEFLAFLDSDDEWLPEKTERQIEVFQQLKGDIGLIFTNGYSEAEKRDFIADNIPSGIYYDPKRNKFYPLRKLIAPPSSWMLPMKVIRGTGYFDVAISTWDDGDYLARVAYRYPLYFLNENLVIWHASQTHLNIMSHELINGKEHFLKKNLEFLRQDREYLFRFYRALGKDALKLDKQKARKYLFKALRINPFDFSTLGKLIKAYG